MCSRLADFSEDGQANRPFTGREGLGRKGTGTFFRLDVSSCKKADIDRKMSQSPAACEGHQFLSDRSGLPYCPDVCHRILSGRKARCAGRRAQFPPGSLQAAPANLRCDAAFQAPHLLFLVLLLVRRQRLMG